MADTITPHQQDFVERAASICLLIPPDVLGTFPGGLHQNILRLAGLPEELACRESYHRSLEEKIERQKYVKTLYSDVNSDESKKDRALELFQLFQTNKEGGQKSIKRTELMRLVGYPRDEIKGKQYGALKRALDRLMNTENKGEDTPCVLADVSSRHDMNVDQNKQVLSPMSSMSKISDKLSKLQISQERQSESLKEIQELRVVAYKVATIIYRAVLEGKLPHQQQLATSDKCAQAVNDIFRLEQAPVVTGAELREGWRVGTPAPMERSCLLAEEDVELLSTLIYTMMALDQANSSSKAMARPDLVSLLGNIVNTRSADVSTIEGNLHGLSLYEMIQGRSFCKQGLTSGSNRDALRLNWLAYESQLYHYQLWEHTCMRLGFARLAKGKRERQMEGRVVFHPLAMDRIINFGHVTLNLNMSGSGIGAGARTPEGDEGKCTIMLGIAGNEPLPPLFIFPSKTNQMTVSPEQIKSMHQIRGQYGADKATFHSVSFAFNDEGCVNPKIFTSWICDTLMMLYPDVEALKDKYGVE